ncbi:MAG: hypothetical protein R3301_06435 [Saprospiraceae bacterium]|nr:hypothetical protein [Saprospiraceae bacterium]
MLRLICLICLTSGVMAQSSQLLEIEVTKRQEGPSVILMAKNHTDSAYIVTVNVESYGMELSRDVPFDVRVAGGKEVRLITLTPLPNKPWSYRQHYSFKPVPPPVSTAREEAPVTEAMREVLDILNREAEEEEQAPPPVVTTPPATTPPPTVTHDPAPAEVRGVAIEDEEPEPPRYEPAARPSSAISRNAYIPAGVSDEFGHTVPLPVRRFEPRSHRASRVGSAYIPEPVTRELMAGRTTLRVPEEAEAAPVRTQTSDPAIPVERPRTASPEILGLRTVAYRVPQLAMARDWYARAFNVQPYFDEPFYVGFNIGGFELGLQPIEGVPAEPGEGSVTYWGVDDIESTVAHFLRCGASLFEPVEEVGGGIKAAAVRDPWGNVIGLIYNPHFKNK